MGSHTFFLQMISLVLSLLLSSATVCAQAMSSTAAGWQYLIAGSPEEALSIGLYAKCRGMSSAAGDGGEILAEGASVTIQGIARSVVEPEEAKTYTVSLGHGGFARVEIDFAEFPSVGELQSVPIRVQFAPVNLGEWHEPGACTFLSYARQFDKATGKTRAWPSKWSGPALKSAETLGDHTSRAYFGLNQLIEGAEDEILELSLYAVCQGDQSDDDYSIVSMVDDRTIRFTVSTIDLNSLEKKTQDFELGDNEFTRLEVSFADIGGNQTGGKPLLIIAEDIEGEACGVEAALRLVNASTGETNRTGIVKWFNTEKGYGFITPGN
jgi:hypothetical protein